MARLKKGVVNVYKLDGKVKSTVKLPDQFKMPLRQDLIRKCVRVYQFNRRQPYGPRFMAGMQHPVSTWGKGRGVARVQRISQGRRGAESPNNVGGRRAHPPRVEKVWSRHINRKERRLTFYSALSATASKDLVRERGHRFVEDLTLPVVVVDDLETKVLTREVKEIFTTIGVYDDVLRAHNGKKIRPGKGKMRGRKYRIPKSILIVVKEFRGIEQGARNLPGVDVVRVKDLNTEHLAPGAHPGRLMVITEGALKAIQEDR